MRAALIDRYGPPEVIRVGVAPNPEPGVGEVRVAVRACGVNGYDLMVRDGRFPANPSFPHILGGEVAGVVDAVGPGTSSTVRPGQAVLSYWARSCGHCEPCLLGETTTCVDYRYLGAHLPGGMAEYIVVPEDWTHLLSHQPNWAAAAAFPTAFGTAWHMLITRGALKPSDVLLIESVGSSIGYAALVLAKLVGATVIATASTQEKLDWAAGLGADHLVNYECSSIRESVMRFTKRRGVDKVFSHVGGSLWARSVSCVTRNGTILVCGGTAGYTVEMNLAQIFAKQISVIGCNGNSLLEFHRVCQMFDEGRLTPYVDTVFSLTEAHLAHQRAEDRRRFGKVVVEVGE